VDNPLDASSRQQEETELQLKATSAESVESLVKQVCPSVEGAAVVEN